MVNRTFEKGGKTLKIGLIRPINWLLHSKVKYNRYIYLYEIGSKEQTKMKCNTFKKCIFIRDAIYKKPYTQKLITLDVLKRLNVSWEI